MNTTSLVPCILEVKASASLQEQIEKELLINDSNKSIANLIENYEEKEKPQNQNQKIQK
jgi:hypothetical protein